MLHVKISVNGSLCSKTEIIGQKLFLVKEKSMSHSSVFPTNWEKKVVRKKTCWVWKLTVMNVAPTRFFFFTYSSHHWGLVPVLERQTCRWRPHRFLHCGKSEGIVQWWSSPYDQDNLLLLSIWSCNGWTS